jgi:hypothetical protein
MTLPCIQIPEQHFASIEVFSSASQNAPEHVALKRVSHIKELAPPVFQVVLCGCRCARPADPWGRFRCLRLTQS